MKEESRFKGGPRKKKSTLALTRYTRLEKRKALIAERRKVAWQKHIDKEIALLLKKRAVAKKSIEKRFGKELHKLKLLRKRPQSSLSFAPDDDEDVTRYAGPRVK